MIPAYERDPAAIYRKSFETIRAEAALDGLAAEEADLAIRLIHACGMTDLPSDLVFAGRPVAAARAALADGAPIFCDVEMVGAGIIRRRLPQTTEIVVTLNDPQTPARAKEIGSTRSAAAVDLWRDRLEGAIVAIGNAPTALFRLLEILEDGALQPAAILAFPVGFVGAVESKDALVAIGHDIPFVTLLGRRGGSAMASAAVNAVVSGLVEERP